MTIRDAWAVYEANTGASETGNGPLLVGASYSAANIGQGVSPGQIASAANPPGIDLASDFSLAHWLEIVSSSFDFENCFISAFTVDNGSKRYGLRVSSGEVAQTVFIRLTNEGGSTLASATIDFSALSLGYHHFAVSVESGSAQLYFNGTAVGSPGAVSSSSTSGNLTQISNNEGDDILCGPISQAVIAAVAYSQSEWTYLYNAGDGRAYASWNESEGGDSIGHINHLTMGCG